MSKHPGTAEKKAAKKADLKITRNLTRNRAEVRQKTTALKKNPRNDGNQLNQD